MDIGLLILLFVLGLSGGLLSGLLGIGGGILMFPLLLHAPVLAGYEAFTVKAAAAITSVQSFFGALSGAFGHHRHNRVNIPLAIYFGGSMSVTSLIGSVASKFIHSDFIIFLFACMAITAAILMLLKKPVDHDDTKEHVAADLNIHKTKCVLWGSSLGLMAGIIGQGGGFLFVPIMLYMLHVPTRVAIGTALIVGVASSTSVLIGRVSTLQIPILFSIITVVGAIIGAQIGAKLSQLVPRKHLTRILAGIIILTAIRMAYGIATTRFF